MNMCPKCSGHKIIGPKYHRRDSGQPERLAYTCFRCGYSATTRTHDQAGSGNPAPSAERAVERAGAKRPTPDPHIGHEEAQQAPTRW